MSFDFKEIFTLTLVLFAVIDVIGSLPILIDLKSKIGKIESGRATLASGIIMIAFLFVGEKILGLIGIDIGSSHARPSLGCRRIIALMAYRDNLIAESDLKENLGGT